MKRLTLLILTVMSIALTSCCDCRKLSKLQKPLLGTTWQLVQIMGHDVKAEGDSYTLLFNEDGTVSGQGDCNILTAIFKTTEKRALDISQLGSTRRLCPDAEGEQAYFDMLDKVTHYEMDGDMMILLSDGTLVAIMKAQGE
ncbi:MAG: META domain-containing protein [Alistipes sp.]|nr:META domain-containing protein [Alistipes sp.]